MQCSTYLHTYIYTTSHAHTHAYTQIYLCVLVLFLQLSHLSNFASVEALTAPLLQTLRPLLECVQRLSSSLPSLFPALGSSGLYCDGESVLSVWTRESPHNYENNSRVNEVRHVFLLLLFILPSFPPLSPPLSLHSGVCVSWC